jgi:hypothetical protein
VVLLQCVTWSFHTEDPADGRLLHAATPILKPHHPRGLSFFSIHEHPGPSVREAIAGNRTYDLEHLKGHLVALRRNVQEVARGDNIVSTWCFDFAERGKVSRPDVLIKEYEVMVERWVLDPVADLLADDGS